MRYEYTEKMLYTQLLFWQVIWDVDNARNKAKKMMMTPTETGATAAQAQSAEGENDENNIKDKKEKILALAEHNRARFETCKGVVDRYLDKCGRSWVAMDGLFGFLL